LPEQVDACAAAADGDPCSFTGTPDGVCRDGICTARGCGDGFVNALEECEPGVAIEGDCTSAGFQDPGPLGCLDTCQLDVSACTGFCGDGRRGGGEACDGDDLDGRSCLDFGYYAAPGLTCSPFTCTFVTTGCGGGRCGDGSVEGPELCEPDLPVDEVCLDLGFDAGRLGCSQACAYDLSTCARIGWHGAASGTTAWIYAMWGAAADDVWAVGAVGHVVHWDGTAWAEVSTPTTRRLRAVWGASASDVWAVGEGGRLVHWDGTAWTNSSLATSGQLEGVWGAAADDVWVVGQGGALFHYDGGGWTDLTSAAITTADLLEVRGTAAGDVWAAGVGVVLHYGGASWTPVDVGEVAEWRGIYPRGAADVFLAGVGGRVRHYDGGGWTAQPVPTTHNLNAIGPYGNGEVAAVGNAGTIAHYDGRTWMVVDPGTSQDLNALWTTPARGWAGGESGTLLRIDGNDLIGRVGSPTSQHLFAIYGTGLDDVFVSGAAGVLAHFDGAAWTTIPTGNGEELIGLWSSPTVAYAVGTGGVVCKVVAGSATCTVESIPALLGVWGAAADDVWITGDSGVVLHGDGSSWTDRSGDVTGNIYFNDVAGSDADHVFAPGSLGRVARWDGISWTVDTPATDSLVGVWAEPAGPVYVIGNGGVILAWDGAAWAPVSSGTVDPLIEIDGDGDHVLAVGRNGAIVARSGGVWSPVRSPVSIDLNAVMVSGNVAVIVGDNGVILEYRWY